MTDSSNQRSINDSQELPASAERVFESLISPTEIQLWWQANTAIIIPRAGGLWCASWGKDADAPDYVMAANILEFVPSELLILGDFKYFSRVGDVPGLQGIKTEFRILQNASHSNRCKLEVTQSGFPPVGTTATDAFFDGCIVGWRSTLESLLEFFGGEMDS